MIVPKVKISFQDWHYSCRLGCCQTGGTFVRVNGEYISNENQNKETFVKNILKHLGFDVEFTYEEEDKVREINVNTTKI